MSLDVAEPYLDYQAVAAARRIPPWNRFMSGWHRWTMTAHCPADAALRTTDYSVSSDRRHHARDLAGFAQRQTRRQMRKIAQLYLDRAFFAPPQPIHPECMPRLRRIGLAPYAIERLRDVGLLTPWLEQDRIADQHFARMLTIGPVCCYLDCEVKLPRPSLGAAVLRQ